MRLFRRIVQVYRNEGPVSLSREVLSYLSQAVSILANRALGAVVSRVIPREQGLWVFGTPNGRFVQNSKYLFLYVAGAEEGVRPVWLSTDDETIRTVTAAGYEAHHAYSPRGLWCLARAECALFSAGLGDLGLWGLAGGATTVNLWHGNPIKEFRVSNWQTNARRSADRVVVTSSGDSLDLFGEVPWTHDDPERYRREQAITSGYPRNDVLFGDVPDATLGLDRAVYETVQSLHEEYVVFGYFPTHRPYPEENPIFDDEGTLRALDDHLRDVGGAMVLKHHPSVDVEVDPDRYERIVLLPGSFDIYPVLSAIDCLVTDYSSVYFGFLLLDRPIVLFPYDDARYEREYGFQYDYDRLPGPKARSTDELLEWLARVADGADPNPEARREVRDRFYDDLDGAAARRVVEALRGSDGVDRPP